MFTLYRMCDANCGVDCCFFPLGDYWMSAKAWCAFVHVIKEYWSNWMRCAKISVIINMITSNYILRYFLYWKSISLCGHTTISACVVCKSTTMELFISVEKERLTRFFVVVIVIQTVRGVDFRCFKSVDAKIWCETKEKWFSKFINRSQIAI